MLIVGSYSTQYTLENPKDFRKEYGDIDVICTNEEFKSLCKQIINNQKYKVIETGSRANGKRHVKFLVEGTIKIIDADILDDKSNQFYNSNRFLDSNNIFYIERYIDILGVNCFVKVIKPVVYYLMKHSHKYLKNNSHFLKTMQDIKYFENTYHYSLITSIPIYSKFYCLREKETYNYKHPKLNTSKKEFFTDSVPYQFDHDSIHEAVKMLDKPAYMYYIKDEQQVECSKEKFDALPHIVKLYGVLEESYVLALERAIIPHGTDTERAFDIALEKVCTSITSGWFREFAWEHYEEVKALYHHSFLQKFLTAQAEGRIMPYTK